MPAQKPEQCDELFESGINAGDVDAVVALYEPDATLVPAPGQTANGTAAIHEAIAGIVAADGQMKLNVTRVVTAGDVAITYNDWSGTMAGPDGAKIELSGKAIEVCRRQPDGTWKFIIDDPFGRA